MILHMSLQNSLNTRKHQRRQAAGALVSGLFSSASSVAAHSTQSSSNEQSSQAVQQQQQQLTKTGKPKKPYVRPKRKSVAQPRPEIQIPPRGIGPVLEPNVNDVLCGRGGRINRHIGNIKFRDIIQGRRVEYLATETKKLEKAHIAAEVVRQIRNQNPPGRFLKEDPDGRWFDVGDAKAIKKVGQAFRENMSDAREDLTSASPGGTPSLDNKRSVDDDHSDSSRTSSPVPAGRKSPPSSVRTSPVKSDSPAGARKRTASVSGDSLQLQSHQQKQQLQSVAGSKSSVARAPTAVKRHSPERERQEQEELDLRIAWELHQQEEHRAYEPIGFARLGEAPTVTRSHVSSLPQYAREQKRAEYGMRGNRAGRGHATAAFSGAAQATLQEGEAIDTRSHGSAHRDLMDFENLSFQQYSPPNPSREQSSVLSGLSFPNTMLSSVSGLSALTPISGRGGGAGDHSTNRSRNHAHAPIPQPSHTAGGGPRRSNSFSSLQQLQQQEQHYQHDQPPRHQFNAIRHDDIERRRLQWAMAQRQQSAGSILPMSDLTMNTFGTHRTASNLAANLQNIGSYHGNSGNSMRSVHSLRTSRIHSVDDNMSWADQTYLGSGIGDDSLVAASTTRSYRSAASSTGSGIAHIFGSHSFDDSAVGRNTGSMSNTPSRQQMQHLPTYHGYAHARVKDDSAIERYDGREMSPPMHRGPSGPPSGTMDSPRGNSENTSSSSGVGSDKKIPATPPSSASKLVGRTRRVRAAGAPMSDASMSGSSKSGAASLPSIPGSELSEISDNMMALELDEQFA